jgi:DNA (cytosine-5)-methyltransferase 1
MNYIDFFCGAGGLSVGLESEGLDLIFANDINQNACKTIRHNLKKIIKEDVDEKILELPIEKLLKIITQKKVNKKYMGKKHMTLKNKELYDSYGHKYKKLISKEFDFKKLSKENLGEVDLIVGGPPCQGFSIAARGSKSIMKDTGVNFIDDPRNQLFKYFLEFVEYYNPKIVLIENVKGLLSAHGYLPAMIESLKKIGIGYESDFSLIDCSKFGIPQKRERVFIVGIRKDIKDSASFIYNYKRILSNIDKKKITLKDAIGDLPNIRSNPKKLNLGLESEKPIGNPKSFGENISRKTYSSLIKVETKYVKEINKFNNYEIKADYLYNHKARFNNQDDIEIYKKLKSGLTLMHSKNKEARKLVKYKLDSFSEKYFKLNPNKPSRTIVAHLGTDTNGYVHYGRIPRGISPREAARIQSFPDWYEFKGAYTKQYEQIGNAVPPLIGRFFGGWFKSFLEGGYDKSLKYISKYKDGE